MQQLLSFFPPTTGPRFSRQWNSMLLNTVKIAQYEGVNQVLTMAKNTDVFSEVTQQQAVLLSLRRADGAITQLLIESGFSLPEAYQTYLNLRQQMVAVYQNVREKKKKQESANYLRLYEEKFNFLEQLITAQKDAFQTPLAHWLMPLKIVVEATNYDSSAAFSYQKNIETLKEYMAMGPAVGQKNICRRYRALLTFESAEKKLAFLNWDRPLWVQLTWPSAGLLDQYSYIIWPGRDNQGWANYEKWYVLILNPEAQYFGLNLVASSYLFEGLPESSEIFQENGKKDYLSLSAAEQQIIKININAYSMYPGTFVANDYDRALSAFLLEKFPDDWWYQNKLREFSRAYRLISWYRPSQLDTIAENEFVTKQRAVMKNGDVLLVYEEESKLFKIGYKTIFKEHKFSSQAPTINNVLLPRISRVKQRLAKIIPKDFILEEKGNENTNKFILETIKSIGIKSKNFANNNQYAKNFLSLIVNYEWWWIEEVAESLTPSQTDIPKVHIVYFVDEGLWGDYTTNEYVLNLKSGKRVRAWEEKQYVNKNFLHFVGYKECFVALLNPGRPSLPWPDFFVVNKLKYHPVYYAEFSLCLDKLPLLSSLISLFAYTSQYSRNYWENLCLSEKIKLQIEPILVTQKAILPKETTYSFPYVDWGKIREEALKEFGEIETTEEAEEFSRYEKILAWEKNEYFLNRVKYDLFHLAVFIGNLNFLKHHYPKNTYTAAQRLALFKFCVAQQQVLVLSTLLELEKEAPVLVDFLLDADVAAQVNSVAPAWWDYVERLIILKLLRAEPQYSAEHSSLGHWLFERAGESRLRLLQLLLDFSYTWEAKNTDQQTVLEAAIVRQVVPVILLLGNTGPFPQVPQSAATALLWQAIDTQNQPLMKLAISWAADLNQPKTEADLHTTPFIACLKLANETLADMLFEANCLAPESYQEYRRIRQILPAIDKKRRRQFVEQQVGKTLSDAEYEAVEKTEQELYAAIVKIIEENPGHEDLTISEPVAKLLAQSQLLQLKKIGASMLTNLQQPHAVDSTFAQFKPADFNINSLRSVHATIETYRRSTVYHRMHFLFFVKEGYVPILTDWPLEKLDYATTDFCGNLKLVINNLHVACLINCPALAEKLMTDHGYSHETLTSFLTAPLGYALDVAGVVMIDKLLRRHANINALLDIFVEKKYFARIEAIDKEFFTYVNTYFTLRLFNEKFSNEETLFHIIARKNLPHLIAPCYDFQLDLNQANTLSQTPLSIALTNGFKDFITKLIYFGASLSADQQQQVMNLGINFANTVQERNRELLKNFNAQRCATQVTMTASTQSLGRAATTAQQQAHLREEVIQLEDNQEVAIGMVEHLRQRQQAFEQYTQTQFNFYALQEERRRSPQMLTGSREALVELRDALAKEKSEKDVLAKQVEKQGEEIQELKRTMEALLRQNGQHTQEGATAPAPTPTFF